MGLRMGQEKDKDVWKTHEDKALGKCCRLVWLPSQSLGQERTIRFGV